jgi:flagellar FliL protein
VVEAQAACRAVPAETAEAAVDPIEYKYITLDKVIVMLRNGEGETGSHYLAVDLVFKTPPKTEKLTKEHLPLLRSVAVRSLSNQTRAQATRPWTNWPSG